MRLSLLHLSACVLFCIQYLPGITQSLNQPVSIPPGEYQLEDLLDLLEEDGIKIAYSSSRLPEAIIPIEASQVTLKEILEVVKQKTDIQYSVSNGSVSLSYTPSRGKKYSLRGIVRDRQTGEVLIGCNILVVGSSTGTNTNQYGFYSLTLTSGKYPIAISYIGYETLIDTILLEKNLRRDYQMTLALSRLNNVTVSAREPNYNISNLIPGTSTLNLTTEGQIPYFLGEVDVLQGALLMPGIRTIGEDASGLNVRGGNVDQNLILLDEAVIYNPNHFYGLISVFNPEAINNVEIMKGFIPPSYGGRASSVITIHQKEGNDEEFKVTGGVGLVSARVIAEGPLKKNRASFLVSARQSIADLSTLGNTSSGLRRNISASFQDFNAKLNWRINRNNTVYLSGYFGNDTNQAGLEATRNWGNRTVNVRWNKIFGPRLVAISSGVISEYNYKVTQPQEAASFIGRSRIVDYTAKTDLSYTISPKHQVEFGGEATFHRLKPGERRPFDEGSSTTDTLVLDSEHGLELSGYFSHKTKMTSKLSAWYGLRYSTLLNFGPGEVYLYENDNPSPDNNITDTLIYTGRKLIKAYHGLEPRASLNYMVSSNNSIKLSYSRTYQYVHLISNTVIPSPTDIWKISNTYIPPTEANIYSVGYYHNFANNAWEGSIELYHKTLNDIIEYRNGADLLFNPTVETELLTGIGRSSGLEFFLKKNVGNLKGWIAYTLSKSELKVDGPSPVESINGGSFFPADHDKRHDLSMVLVQRLSSRLSASASFNFSTGRPVTLPELKYDFEGNLVPHFEDRNDSRLTDYHRLDLSLKLEGKLYKKNGEPRKFLNYWTFVVYNVYGRENAYSYYFRNNPSGMTEIVPFTIFDSPVPAITYNFRF